MNMLNNSYASMERNTPNLIKKMFEGEDMEAQFLFLVTGSTCISITGNQQLNTTKSHKDCDIYYEI